MWLGHKHTGLEKHQQAEALGKWCPTCALFVFVMQFHSIVTHLAGRRGCYIRASMTFEWVYISPLKLYTINSQCILTYFKEARESVCWNSRGGLNVKLPNPLRRLVPASVINGARWKDVAFNVKHTIQVELNRCFNSDSASHLCL